MRTEEAIKFIRMKDQKEEAEIEYQIHLEWQNMVCFSEKVFFLLEKRSVFLQKGLLPK